MLKHLETFNHAVSSIKHPNEKPNFVFMPDAYHDKNPFNIYTSESSISKLYFYLLLFLMVRHCGKFFSIFFCTLSARANPSELLLKMILQQLCQNSCRRNFILEFKWLDKFLGF
jgi:hypothetical protein